MPHQPRDRFGSLDYRQLIDWPARLGREWPFLERVLGGAPSRRVLDLGCGPGEHAALLASHGFEVVGVDGSAAMLEGARARVTTPAARFVLGDLADLGTLVEGAFGAAICLGNTLPSIRTVESLTRMFAGLREHLLEGGVFVCQLLNYEKIIATGQRYLPITFRPVEDGTLLFLRVMEPRAGGDLLFFPTVLRHRPDAEPPVVVEASERVEVHGWTRPEVDSLLESAGFSDRRFYGSIAFAGYSALESGDLIFVARR